MTVAHWLLVIILIRGPRIDGWNIRFYEDSHALTKNTYAKIATLILLGYKAKSNQHKKQQRKGTYRLLKEWNFFDGLGNFEHLLHTKRSQTQEIYTQMQNYKYSHFVHMSTSPSISRYEIGNVSEPLRAYAILRKSGTDINAHSLLRYDSG